MKALVHRAGPRGVCAECGSREVSGYSAGSRVAVIRVQQRTLRYPVKGELRSYLHGKLGDVDEVACS